MELDAASHGYVRFRIVVVHTVATAHIFERIKQIVKKLVVRRIAVVFVLFHDQYDELHVATWCAAAVLVARMMSAVALDVLRENGERRETQIFHG